VTVPRWVKWSALGVWVAGGVAFTVLTEDGDGFDEQTVRTARMRITIAPHDETTKLPRPLEMTIDALVAGGGDRLSLTMDAAGGRRTNPTGPEIEVVVADREDVYFRLLAGGPKLPRGKTWVLMSFDEMLRLAPEFEGVLELADPENVLTSRPPLPDEYATGSETVAGVETTRYEVSGDLDEVGDLAGVSGEMLEEIETVLGEELRMTIWMDEEGFFRRFVVPMSAEYLAPRAGEGVVDMRYEVYDLGGEVTIDLPAEEDVLSP
jgi:hypothetical protein